jgi:hypothetical protein
MPSLVDLVRDYKFDPMMVLHVCRGPLQRSIVVSRCFTALAFSHSFQEQAAADSKASKAAAAAAAATTASAPKGETTAETEAKLKAQVMASRDVSAEDVTMQIDTSEVSLSKEWRI